MSILPSQTNITSGDSWYVKVVGASTVNANQFVGKEIDSLTISTGVLNVGTINVAGGISTSGGDITAVNVFAQNVTATDTMTSYFNNTQYITSYQGGNIHSLLITSNIGGTGTLYYPRAILSTISTAHIILDGNTLDTAGVGLGAALLLNGQPIATASSLTSSILTWSFYPAISTVQMSGNDLLGAATVQGDTANFYDLNAVNQITFGTNLYGATGNLNLLNTNSISTALLITASTATKYISTGSIDVTTISASNIYASNATQTGSLTVMSNATINSNLFIPRSPDPFYGGAIIQGNHSPGFAITNYIDAASTEVYGDVSFHNGRYNFYNNSIEANANIDLHGGTMCNTGRIDTAGATDMTIASGKILKTFSDNDTTMDSKRNFNITASNGIEQKATVALTTIDNGIGVGANSSYRVNAKNGNRGYIELKADPGYAGIQGELHLIANGGSAAGYQTGGFVDIQANAGNNVLGVLSYSRVGILADSVTSYAGGYAPVTGTKGYNFINGSVGVNITAAAVSVVPQLAAGSVYLYGGNPGDAGNSGGVKIQNGLSADKIQPYPDIFQRTDPEYDLIIKGNNEGLKVQLSNIRYIYSDNGEASGFNNITGTNISATGSLFGSNTGASNLTVLQNATASTLSANYISSGSASIYRLIGISTINGYTVDQLVSTVTPPQFYSTVSTFEQLFTSSLIGSNIYSVQGAFSSITGVSTINGYTIAQFVSSVSPQAPAPSTFQDLYTSSFVASNVSSLVINAATILLNGVALGPQISSFLTLQTSSLQTNQLSTGVLTISSINGLNLQQLGTSSFQTLYASSATFLQNFVSSGTIFNASNLALNVSSINGYNTDQFLSTAGQISISSFQEFFVSSLQTNAISTQKLQASDLSTQTLEVSSINGLQLSQLVNPTLSTISTFQQLYTSSLQANTISTGSAFIYDLVGVSSIGGYSIAQLVSSVAPQPPIPSTVQQFYTSSLAVNAIIPYQTGTVTVASDLIALQANTSVTITANTCNVTLDGNTIRTDSTTDTIQIVGNNWAVTAGCNASINSSNTMSIYNTNTAPPVNPNDLYIIGQGVTTLAGQTSLNLIGQTTVALTAPTSVTLTTPSTVCSADLNVRTINGQIPVFGFVDPISTFTNLYATNLFNNPASPDLTLTAAATLIENAGNIIRNADYAITDSALEYTLYTDTSSYIRANSTFTVSAQDKVLIDATDSINFSTPTLLWNGAPIDGGWVSTATTQLNMNSYPITDLTGNLTLSTIGSINLNCYVPGVVVAPTQFATAQVFPQPGSGRYQYVTNNNPSVVWDYVLLTDSLGNTYFSGPWDEPTLLFPITNTLPNGAYYELKINIAGNYDDAFVFNDTGLVVYSVVINVGANFTWGQGASDLVPSGQINLFAAQTNVTAVSTVNLMSRVINLNAVSTIGLAATSNIQLSASRVGLSGVNGQQTLILENPTASLTNSTGDVTIEANSALNLIADNGNAQIYATNGNLNLAASNYVRIYGANIELSNVSSINGVAYTGGGSSWVGTAASDLDMNGYNIGTTAGSNLTVASASQSLEFNQGSSVTTLSNGPGYIDIRAPSGNINLLTSNAITTSGAQYNTSNIGNSLGTFVPFRGYYEPPTGAGQAIELQIEGHAADAGARFLLTYGCDIASGNSYLLGSWPGYILTPLTCYGQTVTLDATESVYLTAGSGNITQTATAAINLVAGGDINIQGAHIALSNLSSINGVAYTGGGSTWVSTATTDLNMNGYNIGTASGSNLSIISSSNLTLATGLQSLVFNQGSLVATLSNGVGSVDIIAPTTNITSSNINLLATGDIALTTSNTKYITIAQLGTGPQSRFELPPNGDFYGYARSNFDLEASNNFSAAASNEINLTSPNINLYGNVGVSGTLYTTTLTNNTSNSDYLTLTATSSITLTASNALVFNSGEGNYFNKFVTLTGSGGSSPLFMNSNGIYCQNGFITQIGELYFKQDGSITSQQVAGVNYLDINAPPTTGSGTGQLRFFGQKGNLIFDDNVTLQGNGTNYVGMYNQYGFVQIATDQNVYIGGGGGNIGGLNIIYMYEFTTIRHTGVVGTGALGLEVRNNGTRNVTPGDLQGSIYVHAAVPNATGESGSQITLDVEGNYGGAVFGGIKVGSWGFLSLLTNNGSGTQTERMRIRGDNGFVGINTTTPAYTLDVNGSTRTTLGIVAGASDVARLILGPTPGTGNYDYCSLIQSESYVAGNYSSQLSFWTHPSAGNYGDPVRRMTIDSGGNVIIATGSLYMSGNTIEMGGTSSNAAYISGLNHVYGVPTGTGSYFGGLIIDYMGGQFYNGGGNDAGIYVATGDHVLALYNNAADILIDSRAYGVNIYGAGVNINPTITFHDEVYTDLGSTPVRQPVIQYGEDSGSGTSGNITIAIPVAYTSATSYVAFASMMDTTDCKISVNRDSASQITIYWSQAGSGTHFIGWNTMGI